MFILVCCLFEMVYDPVILQKIFFWLMQDRYSYFEQNSEFLEEQLTFDGGRELDISLLLMTPNNTWYFLSFCLQHAKC